MGVCLVILWRDWPVVSESVSLDDHYSSNTLQGVIHSERKGMFI